MESPSQSGLSGASGSFEGDGSSTSRAVSSIGHVLSVGKLTQHVLARHNDLQGEFVSCLAAGEQSALALKDTSGVQWLAQSEVSNGLAITATETTAAYCAAITQEKNESVNEAAQDMDWQEVCQCDGAPLFLFSALRGRLGRLRKLLESINPPAHLYFSQIRFGRKHAVAVSRDGAVFTWGDASQGQLGVFRSEPQAKPTLVKRLLSLVVTHVAAGDAHSLAVTNTGRVYAWGRNTEGQLGVSPVSDGGRAVCGNTEAALGPQFVAALEGKPVLRIAAGANHSAAVAASGALFTWGEGSTGQLGVGRVSSSPRPTHVAATDDGGAMPAVADVAAGWGHTVILAQDGSVWATGFNAKGQLGVGDTAARYHPAPVTHAAEGGEFRAVQVAAGRHHCAAITSDGHLYTWGASGENRLGHSQLFSPACLALAQVDAGTEFVPLPNEQAASRPSSVVRPRGQMPGLAGSLYAFPEEGGGHHGQVGGKDDETDSDNDEATIPSPRSNGIERFPESVFAASSRGLRDTGVVTAARAVTPLGGSIRDPGSRGGEDMGASSAVRSGLSLPGHAASLADGEEEDGAPPHARGGGGASCNTQAAQGALVEMLHAMETDHAHPAAGAKPARVLPRTLPADHHRAHTSHARDRVPRNIALAAPPLLDTPSAPISAMARFRAENKLRAGLTSRPKAEGKEGVQGGSTRAPGAELAARRGTAATLMAGGDPGKVSALVLASTALNHAVVSSVGVGVGADAGGQGFAATRGGLHSAGTRTSALAKHAAAGRFRPPPLNNARHVAAVTSALADAGGAKTPLPLSSDAVVVRPTRVEHPALAHRLISDVACGDKDTLVFAPAVLGSATPRSGATTGGSVLTLRGPSFASLVSLAAARYGITAENAASIVPREEWYYVTSEGRFAVGKAPPRKGHFGGDDDDVASLGGASGDGFGGMGASSLDDLWTSEEDAAEWMGGGGESSEAPPLVRLIPIPDVMVRFTRLGGVGEGAGETQLAALNRDAVQVGGALPGGGDLRGSMLRGAAGPGATQGSTATAARRVTYSPAFFAAPLEAGLKQAVTGAEGSWGGVSPRDGQPTPPSSAVGGMNPHMESVPGALHGAPGSVQSLVGGSVLQDTPLQAQGTRNRAAAAAAADRQAVDAAVAAALLHTRSAGDVRGDELPDYGDAMRRVLLSRVQGGYALSAPEVDEVLSLTPTVSAPCEMLVDVIVKRPRPVWADELPEGEGKGGEGGSSQAGGYQDSWAVVRGSSPFSFFLRPKLTSVGPSVVQVTLACDVAGAPPQGPVVSVSGDGVFGAMLSDPIGKGEAVQLAAQVNDASAAREAAEMQQVHAAGQSAFDAELEAFTPSRAEHVGSGFTPLSLHTESMTVRGTPSASHPTHAGQAGAGRHLVVARFKVLANGGNVACVTDTVPAWYVARYSEQLREETGAEGGLDEDGGGSEGSDEEGDAVADRVKGAFTAEICAEVPPIQLPADAMPSAPPVRPLAPLKPRPSQGVLSSAHSVLEGGRTSSVAFAGVGSDDGESAEGGGGTADEGALASARTTLSLAAAWEAHDAALSEWQRAEGASTAEAGGLELAVEVSPNGGFTFIPAGATAIVAAPRLARCEPALVPIAPLHPAPVQVALRGGGLARSGSAQVRLTPVAVWVQGVQGGGAVRYACGAGGLPDGSDPALVLDAEVPNASTAVFGVPPSAVGALVDAAVAGLAGSSLPAGASISLEALGGGHVALDVGVELALSKNGPFTTGGVAPDGGRFPAMLSLASPKFAPPAPLLTALSGTATSVAALPLGVWAHVPHIVDAAAATSVTQANMLSHTSAGVASEHSLVARIVPASNLDHVSVGMASVPQPGTLILTVPPLNTLASVPELEARPDTADSISSAASDKKKGSGGRSPKRGGSKGRSAEEAAPAAPRVPRLLPLEVSVAGVAVELLDSLPPLPSLEGGAAQAAVLEDASGLQEDEDEKTDEEKEQTAAPAPALAPLPRGYLVATPPGSVYVGGVGGGKKGKVPQGEAVTVTVAGWPALLPLQLPEAEQEAEHAGDASPGPVHPSYTLSVAQAPFPELPHSLSRLLGGLHCLVRLTSADTAGEDEAPPQRVVLPAVLDVPVPAVSEEGEPVDNVAQFQSLVVSAVTPAPEEDAAGAEAPAAAEKLLGAYTVSLSIDGGHTWMDPPTGADVVTIIAAGGRKKK